jgi:hypothetical protein
MLRTREARPAHGKHSEALLAVNGKKFSYAAQVLQTAKGCGSGSTMKDMKGMKSGPFQSDDGTFDLYFGPTPTVMLPQTPLFYQSLPSCSSCPSW